MSDHELEEFYSLVPKETAGSDVLSIKKTTEKCFKCKNSTCEAVDITYKKPIRCEKGPNGKCSRHIVRVCSTCGNDWTVHISGWTGRLPEAIDGHG